MKLKSQNNYIVSKKRMDASLRELTRLITEVYPNTNTKGTEFHFSTVYPSPRQPVFNMRDIGTTTIGRKGGDDNSTLKSKKFIIGDYIDVSITIQRESRGGGGADRSDRGGGGRDSRRSPYDRRGRGGGGAGGGHDYR